MSFQLTKDHWFSFKDACVSVLETSPAAHYTCSLFFLHGRFGHSEIWNPIIQKLSPQFRCLLVDFPGFGRSFLIKQRAFSLLEHAHLVDQVIGQFTLPNEKVILVGHDTGGGIAQLCTLKSSEKVAGLVLINSASLARSLDKVKFGFKGCLARWKLNRLLKNSPQIHPQMRATLALQWGESITRSILLKSLQAFDETWPWHYEQQVWKKFLKNLDQPVLILWGKKDPVHPPEAGEDLLHRLPDADFFLDEDCGHWPSLENPEWVLLKMREFIFRINPQLRPTIVRRSL